MDSSCSAMTVLGPIRGEDLGSVLMNEHLVCDPSQRTQLPLRGLREFGGASDDGVATIPLDQQWLATAKARPFGHADNLTCASTNQVLTEWRTIQNDRFQTVLDVCSVRGGRDHKAARNLSLASGVHVIIGTSFPSKAEEEDEEPGMSAERKDIEASKRDMDFMERELLHGIEQSDGVCAGFIGEIEVSQQFTPLELRQLKAAAVVQKLTNAPLLVSEASPSRHALQILDHIQACSGLLDRTVLCHMDMYATDLVFLQQVLERGANVCFDRFSVSSACFDPDQFFPTIQQVANCIPALLRINPSFLRQIVLSSGVFMKLQYRKYGGMGFQVVAEYLLPRLKANGVSMEQIDALTRDNPRRLLQWWKPPPPPIRPKEYIPCSVCKIMFEPILGQYYTKFSFTYCGTKCLREHRKNKFQPLS